MGARAKARRNGCTGKQRHPTQEKAQAHLVSLYFSVAYKGCVYRCSFCGGWHVGRRHNRRR